jgi:hypothetical protein
MVGTAAAAPVQHHHHRYAYSSMAHPRPVHCRMIVQPYSYYQGPDGTYDSLADFTRDLWGVPCGVDCTRAAAARWARAAHCAG